MPRLDSMDSMDNMIRRLRSMSTFDSMDNMRSRAGGSIGLDAFASSVEATRAAIADFATADEEKKCQLTPRGVDEKEMRLPRPGSPGDARLHDPAVRASLYDFTLASGLRFRPDADNESAELRHGDALIARIVRPPFQVFKGQLGHVIDLAQSRTLRIDEVIAEREPQYALWTSLANLDAQRTPDTLELIACGLRLASACVQQFKHHFACPRPIEYSVLVQPMIATPGHRSFPSGHSTEAFMVARLIALLAGTRCTAGMERQLQAQAFRVAQNREVAGVHFPADTLAGRILGDTLAHYLQFRATCDASSFRSRQFDGATYYGTNGQIEPRKSLEPPPGFNCGDAAFKLASEAAKDEPSVLGPLWKRAMGEWK